MLLVAVHPQRDGGHRAVERQAVFLAVKAAGGHPAPGTQARAGSRLAVVGDQVEGAAQQQLFDGHVLTGAIG